MKSGEPLQLTPAEVKKEVQELLSPINAQKAGWKTKLAANLGSYFKENGNDLMVKAVNTRKCIKKKNPETNLFEKLDIKADELVLVLAALDVADAAGKINVNSNLVVVSNETYQLQEPTRITRGGTLITAGFTQNEINSLKLSDRLKYEAALYEEMVKIWEEIFPQYDDLISKHPGKDREILSDKEIFFGTFGANDGKPPVPSELAQAAKPIIDLQIYKDLQILYNTACSELAEATNVPPGSSTSPLKNAGRNVLHAANKAMKAGLVRNQELPALAKYLRGTAKVVKDPSTDNIETHVANTKEIVGINRQWGKLVGGAMLCFLGVVLIALAIVVAIGTYGGATPISAKGIALGGSMMSQGIKLGAAAGIGLYGAKKAGLFANNARKGEIAVAGDEVTKEAKKENKLRT